MPASSLLRVSLEQCVPGGVPEDNLTRVEAAVTGAASSGAQLVVFPEYAQAFSPDFSAEWVSRCTESTGAFVEGLRRLSIDHGGVAIVAGIVEPHQGEARPFNTMVCAHGEADLARAQKIHLYDAFGHHESSRIAPSEAVEPEIVDIGQWRMGMQTCYDLRFPEVTRRLVDRGANLLVIPSQWVPGPDKLDQWRTLVIARAIESQCFVVAVGQPGPHGVGHSMAVTPRGHVLMECGGDEESVVVELDLAVVESVRQENPMESARRFQVNWRA